MQLLDDKEKQTSIEEGGGICVLWINLLRSVCLATNPCQSYQELTETGYNWFTCQTVLAWWQQSWNFLVAVHGVGYKPLSNFLFQDLYGRRSHHPPDLCLNSSFDAIFENPDGIIYVLKGKKGYIYIYISANME